MVAQLLLSTTLEWAGDQDWHAMMSTGDCVTLSGQQTQASGAQAALQMQLRSWWTDARSASKAKTCLKVDQKYDQDSNDVVLML